MKKLLFSLLAFGCFSSCDCFLKVEENPVVEISPDDLPEEVIYVRESSIEVKPAFSWDMHTEGEVRYTEGTILGLSGEERFFLSGERFSSSINYACANSKVNGKEMCGTRLPDCDYSDFILNGSWDINGEVQTPSNFEWEFIDLAKTKKFILKFDQLPKPAKITEYDENLYSSQLNSIRIQKESELDSVFFQLVVIPKSNLDSENLRNFRMTNYRILPIDNQFEIHGEDLFHHNLNKPTDKDSVFINVVTVKRIVKEINGKLIGFTYYVNDPKPIVIK
ncbi:hypothetical protein SAMN00777080_3532 [Aquiflexum balticum DSM 16537]|uniref:Uncharacterized protein n=1 Tax=Aquiflexum balticum DSM 16537 TaxID=758820 RepID=A0A1W2H7K8_9BACT|nr:hypothetical protein [Aquiflexum balticum]SMD44895.1 hypothetical protein SAMN00777080_3532 [Aquiflexum balticum DSM 16537]